MKITLDSFLSVIKQSGLIEPDRLATLLTTFRAESAAAAETAAETAAAESAAAESLTPPGEAPAEATTAAAPPIDAKSFAIFLVKAGHLTTWQAEKLLLGKHKGFTLGKYKLLSLLGKGGMSSVYLAEHKLMRRRVAIKVLPHKRVGDASYLGRFHREAQAVASLDHPNIVRAYDVDHEQDKSMEIHFLVMEHVEGRSMQEIIAQDGPLPPDRAAEYVRQAAEGLQHAHDNGLVHRDIKPGNLLVDTTGTVKLLDLGLARFFNEDEEGESLTIEHDEKVLGTADYLAPEQAVDSHLVDHRADIYSLGCTLYFLLVGTPPFTEGTLAQRLIAHQSKSPPPVSAKRDDVPESLDRILLSMMAKQADDRPQTARDVAGLMAGWLAGQGQNAGDAAAPADAPDPLGGSDYEIETELSDFFNELEGMDSADGSEIGLKAMGSGRDSETAKSGPSDAAGSSDARSGVTAGDSRVDTQTDAASTTPGPTTRGGPRSNGPRSGGPRSGGPRSGPKGGGPKGKSKAGPKSGRQAGRSGVSRAAGRSGARRRPSAASDDFLDTLEELDGLDELPPAELAPLPGSGVRGHSGLKRGGSAKAKSGTSPVVLGLVALLAAGAIAGGIAFFSSPGYDDGIAGPDGPAGPPEQVASRPVPTGNSVTVGSGGDAHFATLAEALAWAAEQPPGKTIELAAGETFAESIRLDGNTIGRIPKQLTLRGSGRPFPILRPTEGDGPVIEATGTKDLTIENIAVDASAAAGGSPRPVAVELAEFPNTTQLVGCEVTGFGEVGIRCRRISNSDRTGDAVLRNVTVRADRSKVDLIRLESDGVTTSGIRIEGCRLLGVNSAEAKTSDNGISFWGNAESVAITRTVFARLIAGVRMGHGRSQLRDITIANNTFYDGYRGIVMGDPPADASRQIRVDRNLFAGLDAPALSVDNIGTVGGKIGPVLTMLGSRGDNYTTTLKPGGREVGAVIDLFDGTSRKVEANFITTSEGSAGYLQPQNAKLRQAKGGPGFVGAVEP